MSSNQEIVAKNLVTFKSKMGLRMKNFDIFRVHWKIQFLMGDDAPIHTIQ